MHKIAEEIGGFTVEQLESVLSLNEQARWQAYFKWKERERKKARKKAQQESKSKNRRGRR